MGRAVQSSVHQNIPTINHLSCYNCAMKGKGEKNVMKQCREEKMEIHGRSCRTEGNGEVVQTLDELFTRQSKCIDKPGGGLARAWHWAV